MSEHHAEMPAPKIQKLTVASSSHKCTVAQQCAKPFADPNQKKQPSTKDKATPNSTTTIPPTPTNKRRTNAQPSQPIAMPCSNSNKRIKLNHHNIAAHHQPSIPSLEKPLPAKAQSTNKASIATTTTDRSTDVLHKLSEEYRLEIVELKQALATEKAAVRTLRYYYLIYIKITKKLAMI